MVFLCSILLKLIFFLRYPKRISIADTTRRLYVEHVLELFRSLERITLKLEKAKTDLSFLEQCRSADLIPRFLQFKLSSRKLSNCSETTRTKRRLLDIEIRSKNKRIKFLSNRVTQLSYDLI